MRWQSLSAEGRVRFFFGPLNHTQMRALAFGRHSQLSGSERVSQTLERADPRSSWDFPCTLRLDPNAAFPGTHSRSLNIHSVSKNAPDRNPVGLRFHANTWRWGAPAPMHPLSPFTLAPTRPSGVLREGPAAGTMSRGTSPYAPLRGRFAGGE